MPHPGSLGSRVEGESEGNQGVTFHPSRIAPEIKPGSFLKGADPPKGWAPPEELALGKGPFPVWKKTALPKVPEEEDPKDERARSRKGLRAGAGPPGAQQKEALALEEFDRRTLEIYATLSSLPGVDMDITRILRDQRDDDEWLLQFKALVRPRRAATGLRYVRLMEKYLAWRKERSEGESENPFDKDLVWKYIHSLTVASKGRYTPKSVQHAVQFFADAFGAECLVSGYRRIKRLVETHIRRDVPRVSAPMIPVGVLSFLEDAVASPKLKRGQRVACGKLRLCAQAALRWDDLVRTPILSVEWVRRRGEAEVVGLRTRQAGSKTGNRPWVSSYLGVRAEGDDWLSTLIHLVLQDDGGDWEKDDHFGKAYTKDFTSASTAMASFGQDVEMVRQVLAVAAEGGEVPITVEEALSFRWHGAKPTLTSIMMHLDIGERAVRFAGNWKNAQETMTDTYLRESQLLVLRAQERALSYLRSGGDIFHLEGLGLAGGVAGTPPDEMANRPVREGALRALQEADQTPPSGLNVSDVSPGLLDAVGASVAMEVPADEALASERAIDIKEEELAGLLDGPTVEEVESNEEKAEASQEAEASEGEDSTTSDEEFYAESFLAAGSTVRSALHKPNPCGDGPRCGISAKRFQSISCSEAFSGKTLFCQRCFGKPSGCDKVCSRTKQIERDGEIVRRRCLRRCVLGCDPIAKFLDEDKRGHLCANHREEFSKDEEPAVVPTAPNAGRANEPEKGEFEEGKT